MTSHCRRCETPLELAPGAHELARCKPCQMFVITARHAPSNSEGPPPPPIEVPQSFVAEYQLEDVLGQGAYGAVLSARAATTGRRVAVKLLRMNGDVDACERFVREARFLARVSHPNVLKVFDVGRIDVLPYIVMQLMPGGSLADRIGRRFPMHVAEAIHVGAACLDGLAACHELNIIHRDLKPANILFGDDGQPRIADFGVAFQADAETTRLTRTGYIVGTPFYMPPETIVGGAAAFSADLYAMGMILYEMIAGAPPFHARRMDEFLGERMSGPPLALDAVAPHVSRELSAFVSRMLAPRAEERPQSAREAAVELRALGVPAEPRGDKSASVAKPALKPGEARESAPARDAAPPRDSRRSSLAWAAGGAIACAALGFGAGRLSVPPPRAEVVVPALIAPAASESPLSTGQEPPPPQRARPAADAARRLGRAADLLATNHPDRALAELGERGTLVEPTAQAAVLAGHVYVALSRGSDAEAMYRAAVSRRAGAAESQVDARVALARLLISKGSFTQARTLLAEAVTLSARAPTDPATRMLNANAHVALGEILRIERQDAAAAREYALAIAAAATIPDADVGHPVWLMHLGFWKLSQVSELKGRETTGTVTSQGVAGGAMDLFTR